MFNLSVESKELIAAAGKVCKCHGLVAINKDKLLIYDM
jgi:hypothetical protein